jgi:hypothetical protein
MPTPLDYKKRYEGLPVPLTTGASASVSVTKYRATFMGSGDMAVNTTAMNAFDGKFHDFAKKGFPSDLTLQVDTGQGLRAVTDDEATKLYSPNYGNALRALKSAFQGKGSPELCQLVLQLAIGSLRTPTRPVCRNMRTRGSVSTAMASRETSSGTSPTRMIGRITASTPGKVRTAR